MAVTSLILGFKEQPEVSLQDSIIVSYLLLMSSTSIFVALVRYSKLESCDRKLRVLSVLQTYIILAFIFSVLGTASSFGSTPRCNGHAVIVIFGRFKLLGKGWVAVLVINIIITAYYTFITYLGYRDTVINFYRRQRKKIENTYSGKPTGVNAPDPLPPADETEDFPHADASQAFFGPSWQPARKEEPTGITKTFLIELGIRIIFWAAFVLNTELLIIWSRFDSSDPAGQWSFGQILPLFLIALPLLSIASAFIEGKFKDVIKRRAEEEYAEVHGDFEGRYNLDLRRSEGSLTDDYRPSEFELYERPPMISEYASNAEVVVDSVIIEEQG